MVRAAPGCLPFCLDDVWAPHKFVERPAEINYLREHLLPDGCRRGSPLNRIFILHGLGGIGKTQLAAHFAYTHIASYVNVVWLNASSKHNLRKSLATYGSRLVELEDRQMDSSEESLANLATIWLSSTQNRGGLLILDGVGGKCGQHDALSGSYIKACLRGFQASILVTTRLAHLSQLGHSRRLGNVDKNTSIAIFSKWCTVDKVTAHLLELIDLLAGLPLALVIAANFIQESGCSINSWVQMYDKDWNQAMTGDLSPVLSLLGGNFHDIGSEWRGSCRVIHASDATAGKFLLLWASLGHGDLWYELLRPVAQMSGSHAWLSELCEESRFLQIVKSILRLSLAEQVGNLTYRMHPVLVRWMTCAQKWPLEDLQDCQRIALCLTASAIPPVASPDFAAQQQRLLPAADARVKWLKQDEPRTKSSSSDFMIAVGAIGGLYADQGSLHLAEWLYRRALEDAHRCWNVLDVLRVQSAFTKVLARLHKDAEAEGLCEAIREKCRQVLPHHVSGLLCRQADCNGECIKRLSAETSRSLATLFTRQGRPKDAEKLFNTALEMQKELDGVLHCSTLDTINDLGVFYTQEGFLEDAEEQLRLVLDWRKQALGSSHPLSLQTLANLSLVRARQGHLQEAEELCSQAAEGVKAVYGWFHDTTLSIHHNLAFILGQQGLFVDAAAMYRRVEEGCAEVFGDQHSLVLHARHQAAAMSERARESQEVAMAVSLVRTDLGDASPAALSSHNDEIIKTEHL